MKPMKIMEYLKEDEDWEDSSEWKDKEVVANMPSFNKGIEEILDDLYSNGYVTYYNYLEATLHFSSNAEDEEYTTPKQYSTLKERLIKCAAQNNFIIDEKSFSAEVTDGNDFDPELAYWDVVFKFALTKNNLKESDEYDDIDQDVLTAFEEYGWSPDKEEVLDKIRSGDYIFFPGVTNAKELGEADVDMCGGPLEAVGADRISNYFDEDSWKEDMEADVRDIIARDNNYDSIDDVTDEELNSYLNAILDDEISVAKYDGNNKFFEDYFDYESWGNDLLADYTITSTGAIRID